MAFFVLSQSFSISVILEWSSSNFRFFVVLTMHYFSVDPGENSVLSLIFFTA